MLLAVICLCNQVSVDILVLGNLFSGSLQLPLTNSQGPACHAVSMKRKGKKRLHLSASI